MNIEIYNRIAKSNFSQWGSWAVWKEPMDQKITSNIADMCMFDVENIQKTVAVLNPHFILVGLNVSRSDDDRKDGYSGPWANFHSDSPNQKDYKLRYALKETKAWGCYLTDIIKDYKEVNSYNVTKYLRENTNIEANCVTLFKEELLLLGDNDPTIIALGGKTFDILIRNFGGQYRIAKAPHYSGYINIEDYRKEMQVILNRCK